jgi:hypothetical protein
LVEASAGFIFISKRFYREFQLGGKISNILKRFLLFLGNAYFTFRLKNNLQHLKKRKLNFGG